jgi:hypothetical protein
MLLEYERAAPDSAPALVTGVISWLVNAAWPPSGWRLYGDTGTLLAAGATSFPTITRQSSPDKEPESLPIPQRLLDALPDVPGAGKHSIEVKWAALVRDLVADTKGEPHEPYLTFQDGWRYQAAIDAIRSGAGWQDLLTAS